MPDHVSCLRLGLPALLWHRGPAFFDHPANKVECLLLTGLLRLVWLGDLVLRHFVLDRREKLHQAGLGIHELEVRERSGAQLIVWLARLRGTVVDLAKQLLVYLCRDSQLLLA